MVGTTRRGVDKLGIVVFGTLSLITAGMGTWQVQRYKWKLGLVEERKRKLNAQAVPLGLTKADHEEYERVHCKGTYDYSKTMLVGPRHAPKNSAADTHAMSQSGYVVVTPFRQAQTGTTVLVNRGWIGRHDTNVALSPEQTPGTVEEFDAVVSKPELAGAFTPPQDDKTGVFFMLDSPKLATAAGLADPESAFMVERVDGAGHIVCKSTSSMLDFRVHPATHVGYAATWYGLCGAGLFMIKKRFL